MEINKQCVLFIDDDKATNFFNSRVAKNHGHFETVITVSSGLEGLNYIKRSSLGLEPKPNLIFLDINMPAMTGWEFLQEFYSLNKRITEGIDVAILSTSTEPSDINRFKENECLVDFVNKPINIDTLNNVLSKVS